MNYSESITNALNSSSVEESSKHALLSVANALRDSQGRQLLSILADDASVDLFSSESDPWVQYFVNGAKTLNALEAGSVDQVINFLNWVRQQVDLGFGSEVAPYCEDLQKMLEHSQVDWPKPLLGLLTDVELIAFFNLSDYCKANFVRLGIVYGLKVPIDVLSKFRRAYYLASPDYDDGAWGQQFLPWLKKNQEIFGEKITYSDKDFAPTVENWLREYDAFSGKPGPQRQALDRLHFVQDNPNAKTLSKEDQQILLKLCELYDWFSDPYVTEAEVAEFEDVTPATSRPGLLHTEAPVLNTPVREALEDRAEAETESPNVQGALVQTPLGVSKSGLEVSADADAHTPEGPSHMPSEEKVIGSKATEFSSKAEPVKQPRPVSLPPLATPIIPKAGSSVSRAALLDMDAIKAEAEKKKQMVQADIDKKLSKLKG